MQRGLGEAARCGGLPSNGGFLRCSDCRGFPHERYAERYPLGLHQEGKRQEIKCYG